MVFPRPPKVGVFVTLQSTRSHMHEGFDQLGTKNVGDQIEDPPRVLSAPTISAHISHEGSEAQARDER